MQWRRNNDDFRQNGFRFREMFEICVISDPFLFYFVFVLSTFLLYHFSSFWAFVLFIGIQDLTSTVQKFGNQIISHGRVYRLFSAHVCRFLFRFKSLYFAPKHSIKMWRGLITLFVVFFGFNSVCTIHSHNFCMIILYYHTALSLMLCPYLCLRQERFRHCFEFNRASC